MAPAVRASSSSRSSSWSPWAHADRRVAEELVGAPHVRLGGADVADSQPEDEPAAEPRVRQKDLAARVHAREDRLVQGIERRAVIAERLRRRAEADEAERYRRRQDEDLVAGDPVGERPRDADVLADPRSQARGAEPAHHHPELERAEPPAER